ncbi:hypothetical protein LCGC14_0157100 [marine sediment metagenome]|uniref:Uncharacterized protein n=1 Tax=marine sediment metagenome TaxID=412755 RepID=A0A0F9XEW4_9ZZZZ
MNSDQQQTGQNNDPRKPVEPGDGLDSGMEGPFEGEDLKDVDPEKIREKMDEVENDGQR